MMPNSHIEEIEAIKNFMESKNIEQVKCLDLLNIVGYSKQTILNIMARVAAKYPDKFKLHFGKRGSPIYLVNLSTVQDMVVFDNDIIPGNNKVDRIVAVTG